MLDVLPCKLEQKQQWGEVEDDLTTQKTKTTQKTIINCRERRHYARIQNVS